MRWIWWLSFTHQSERNWSVLEGVQLVVFLDALASLRPRIAIAILFSNIFYLKQFIPKKIGTDVILFAKFLIPNVWRAHTLLKVSGYLINILLYCAFTFLRNTSCIHRRNCFANAKWSARRFFSMFLVIWTQPKLSLC